MYLQVDTNDASACLRIGDSVKDAILSIPASDDELAKAPERSAVVAVAATDACKSFWAQSLPPVTAAPGVVGISVPPADPASQITTAPTTAG